MVRSCNPTSKSASPAHYDMIHPSQSHFHLLFDAADASVATSMSIINRLALLVFPLPTVLLLLQMSATLVILYPLLWTKTLTFNPWSFRRFQQLLGISFFYTANTAFALFGLRGMNLPMYTAVKRLTPMSILVIKVWALESDCS